MHNPCCCGCCKNSEVVLLVDTTGSMGPFIQLMQTIFNSFEDDFSHSTCRWAVVEYKDYEDGGDFSTKGCHILQKFTNNWQLITQAVNSLSAGGGGDLPEQNFSALKFCADKWFDSNELDGQTHFPPGAILKRVILWGGDAPGWNNGAKSLPYPTRQQVIQAMEPPGQAGGREIKVFALNVGNPGEGLDGGAGNDGLPNQASEICAATFGQLFNNINDFEQIRDIMCQALRT